MFNLSSLAVVALSLSFIALVVKLLRHFGRGNDLIIYFITPLIVYSGGYILRLTDNKSLINIGYFMTDYSFMFVYTIFATAVLLGQLRYWKK